jgi:translation initiation factor IF-1
VTRNTKKTSMSKKNRGRGNQQYESGIVEERQDRLEFEGRVEEALPGTLFRVKTSLGSEVMCTLSGKLRINRIRLLPGDNVTIEVSPYDVTRGRITWRR